MANGYGPPDPWRLGGTWGPTGVPSLLSPSAIDEEEWERRLREMELARRQQEARGQRVPANYQPTTAQPSLFQEALEAQSQRQGFTLGDWQQQERARQQQAQQLADAQAAAEQRFSGLLDQPSDATRWADPPPPRQQPVIGSRQENIFAPAPRGIPEGYEVIDDKLVHKSRGRVGDFIVGGAEGYWGGLEHGTATAWNLLGKLPGATEAEQERYERLSTGARESARERAGRRPETGSTKAGEILGELGLLAATYGGSSKIMTQAAKSLVKYMPGFGRLAAFGRQPLGLQAPRYRGYSWEGQKFLPAAEADILKTVLPNLSPGRRVATKAALGAIEGAERFLAPATRLGRGARNVTAFLPMDFLLASDPENIGLAPIIDDLLGTDVNSAWWKRAVANMGFTAAFEVLLGLGGAGWAAAKNRLKGSPVEVGVVSQGKETLKERFSLPAGETPAGLLAKPAEPPPMGFHGTKSEFDAFSLARVGQSDPGLVGEAVYFSPSEAQAKTFAESPQYGGRGGTPRVVSAPMEFKNPMVIEDGILPDGRSLSDVHPSGITPESGASLQEEIIAAGHDGVIFRVDGEPTQYAVFNPEDLRISGPEGLLPAAKPPREFKGSVLQQEKPWTGEGKETDVHGYRIRGPAASADDALRPETMGSMLDEGYTANIKTAVSLAGNRRSSVLEHIEQGPKKATWDQWAQHLTRKKGLKKDEVNMVLSRMRAPPVSREEIILDREWIQTHRDPEWARRVAAERETFQRAVPEGLILREDVEALVRDIYGDLAVVELDEEGLSRALSQHFEDRELVGDPEYGPSEDDWVNHIEGLEHANLMLSPSIGNPLKSWAGGLSGRSNMLHDIQGTGRLKSSFTAARPIGFEIVDNSLVSQGYRDSHFGNPGAIVHVRMIEPAYSLEAWGISQADVQGYYDKAFPEGRFGRDQHGKPWNPEVQEGITPVEAYRMGLKDPERIHGLHPRSWVVGEIQSDRGQQMRERAILRYGNEEFERIARRRIEESGLRYGEESAARVKIKQNLYEELLREAKVPALVDPSAHAAKKERMKAYGVLWRRAKTDVREKVLDYVGRDMGLGPLEEVPFHKTEQQMRLAVDEILQRAAQNNIREVVFPTEAQINRVYEGETTNPGGPYAQILPKQIKAAAKSIGATVKELDLDNPANYDRAKLWERERLVPSQIRGREGEDPYYRQSDHGNQPRAERHPDYGEGDLGTRVDKNTVVEIPDELARRMRGEIPGEEVSTKMYSGAVGDISGLLGVGMEDESPDEFTAQDLLRLGLLGFAGSQAGRRGRRTAKPAVSQKAEAAVRRIDKFDPKLKVRLRTEYPATEVSKVMTFDPKRNQWFFAKVKSDEQKLLESVVSDINPDIAARNYPPFFDVSERRLADPTSYGLLENIKAHGDVGYPKVNDWVKKHNTAFNTPDARKRLKAAYDLVEGNELARLWYGMGQLQDFFIDQLGQEAGLRAFDDRVAKGLAVTTAGQAPFANLRTAAYADFQSARDLPMPRQLEKPAGLKPGDPRLVETDLGMQRRNLETGELEWPEKPPYPVGGRFGARNLETYEKVMGEGGGLLTAQNPKEFSFRGNLLGEANLMSTIDEQMMVGMYPAQPGTVQRKAPPSTAYRIIRDVVGDVANDIGTSLIEMQAVAWSGFKTRSDALTGYAKELGKKNAGALTPKEREQALQSESFSKAWAEIKPLIQVVNEAIERTARLTGQTPKEVATRWVMERAPLYGIAGIIAASMSQEESN